MRSHFRMLRVRKSINYHNGAMADATAAILEHFELGGDDVLILSNTVSHRLPRAVINLVMEELVRPFPDVFAVCSDHAARVDPVSGQEETWKLRDNCRVDMCA